MSLEQEQRETIEEARRTLKRSYWKNRLYAWLHDRVREQRYPTIEISSYELATRLRTERRQIILAMRSLERLGLVEVERRVDEFGTSRNAYTVLPINPKRRAKLDRFVSLSGITRAEGMRAIFNLKQSQINPSSMTISDLADLAGYAGNDPRRFVRGLIDAGILTTSGLIDF